MNRFGLSFGTVLIVVFAAAADCMAMRSIQGRPLSGQGVLELTLLGTLPMANVLAVVTSALIWRRRTPRGFRLGFVVGGALAVAVTAIGTRPGLDWLEATLESTEFGVRLSASPRLAWAVAYLALPGLALFFQLVAAVIVGGLAKALSTGGGTLAFDGSPRRRRLVETLTMMLLIAAPALLIEGSQRWTTDPTWARLKAGERAVVDVRVMNGFRAAIGKGATFLLTNGTEVEVEDDSQPPALAGVMAMGGKEQQFGDHRSVRVTLLKGEHAGERTSAPRQFLRVVR